MTKKCTIFSGGEAVSAQCVAEYKSFIDDSLVISADKGYKLAQAVGVMSDKQSAQEIISAFEEKQQLADLVTETLASEDSHGIQVYIGDETPVKTMKDCSVVTATYELGEGMKGTIGIIGPKRMDYEHVMKTLKILQGELDLL